jgi:hypothetical protein
MKASKGRKRVVPWRVGDWLLRTERFGRPML